MAKTTDFTEDEQVAICLALQVQTEISKICGGQYEHVERLAEKFRVMFNGTSEAGPRFLEAVNHAIDRIFAAMVRQCIGEDPDKVHSALFAATAITYQLCLRTGADFNFIDIVGDWMDTQYPPGSEDRIGIDKETKQAVKNLILWAKNVDPDAPVIKRKPGSVEVH